MNHIVKWDEINGSDDSGKRMDAFLGSTTDSYAIFQLKAGDETRHERFLPLEALERDGITPNIDYYEMVYVGDLTLEGDRDDVLEDLYLKFNLDCPADFKGRTLSVSDIVALNVGGVVSSHYVDYIGFTELPNFIPRENYLKHAEMTLEDDYGMIDGLVNNGPKQDPPVERISVLEQLKRMSVPERTSSPTKNRIERDQR